MIGYAALILVVLVAAAVFLVRWLVKRVKSRQGKE
jgi:hypothetical protein